jgi:16S rRNA (uracil1498-N3)-methyltransferase
MVIPRFYVPQQLAVGARISLPEAVANHAVRVLRLQPGDALVLFNGEGGAYAGHLLAREPTAKAPSSKKQRDARSNRQTIAEVLLEEFQPDDRASNLRINLWQGVSAAERMDYTWQKSVELGVSRCVPVETRRCVTRLDAARAEKRHAHWQGVIVSAAEQCGLNRLPELLPVQTLTQALVQPVGLGIRVMLDPDAMESFPVWLERQTALTDLTILIGPEGGFAPEEISAAQAAGFLCFRLGPRIFRTETAGPVALAVTQAIAGDLR